MKNIRTSSILAITATVVVCIFFLTLSACDGQYPQPEPELTSGEQRVANLVNSTWKVESVTIDGSDKSSMFANFSIVFSPAVTNQGKPSFNGTYSATNGGPIWQSGSWQISDASAPSFTRGDNVVVSMSEVSSTKLKMSLNWSKTTFGSGRTRSVKGLHVFVMTK